MRVLLLLLPMLCLLPAAEETATDETPAIVDPAIVAQAEAQLALFAQETHPNAEPPTREDLQQLHDLELQLLEAEAWLKKDRQDRAGGLFLAVRKAKAEIAPAAARRLGERLVGLDRQLVTLAQALVREPTGQDGRPDAAPEAPEAPAPGTDGDTQTPVRKELEE